MKKKYLLILFFITSFTGIAQNRISFSEKNKSEFNLSKNFKTYKVLEINDNLQRISNGQKITISLDKEYVFTLKENRIFSNNYTISVKEDTKISQKTLADIGFDGKYFTNENISENNQFVFSMFENSYSIYIKTESSNFYIEPLKKFDSKANPNQYILYKVEDIINTEISSCGVGNSKPNINLTNPTETARIGGCKTVEIAFSIDYTMYSSYGSINGVINRTLEVLNLSQANYAIANGISDDTQFKVTEHYIVACNTCNYWPTTLEIYDNYNGLASNASRMFVNPYDLKIHWQNQGGSGSVVGLGALSICNGVGKGVVKNYASNTNYIRCILSHEIGHNFGCAHSSGFIMNSSVSGSNSWAPESITTINNALANYTCFSNCDITPCDNKKVSDLLVTPDNITNKINVSWLAEAGIDFKVRLFNNNTNTWTAYTTFTYPANTTFYDFTAVHCFDKYRVEIVPVCAGINGISEQVVVETNKNVAAPTLTFSSSSQNQAICGNGRVYNFSVASIDGGTTPIYQWKINGVNVGTNSATFSSTTLLNGDVLSCELTSNATCVASSYASVSAILSVTTPTVLSVAVSANTTTICAGGSVTLTATGTNIDSSFPYYQWLLNGLPPQGGSAGGLSGPVITVYPANNGDVYTCVLYDDAACHTTTNATSNTTTITIENPCTLTVNEFELLDLNYYPNPAKDILFVSAKEEITSIEIYTILGQKINTKKINAKKTALDLSYLPNEVYVIKINANNKFKNIKIVKN